MDLEGKVEKNGKKIEELEERVEELEIQNTSNKDDIILEMVENQGKVETNQLADKFDITKKWAIQLMRRVAERDGIRFQIGSPHHPSFIYCPDEMDGVEFAKAEILRKMKEEEMMREETIKKRYDLSDKEWHDIKIDLVKFTRQTKNRIKFQEIGGKGCIINANKFNK